MTEINLLKESWYQYKLNSLLAVIVSMIVAYFSYEYYESSKSYRPIPQQVILDIYNRPIGVQNLLKEISHNPQYRKQTPRGAEPAEDFLKEALLSLFNYDRNDLDSGVVLENFTKWLEPGEGERVYSEVFVNLSQQKIVDAQDGIVRSRIIGDFNYVGTMERPYVSSAGLDLVAITHKFTGRMVITAYGEREYPAVYNNVTAIVQRALLQDKYHGYQIIQLDVK